VVTHRQSLVDLADDVVVLAPAEVGAANAAGHLAGLPAPARTGGPA